jgi:hypothetical protein
VFACVVVVTALGTACQDLDGFVWNPRQCSTIDPTNTDCTVKHMCTPCATPLPFESFGIPASSVQQVPVKTQDGVTLDTYFITGTGARPNDVIVYAHGNFGGIEHYLNRVALLYATGANLYVIDYRGFGKSSTTDEPTEPQFDSDTVLERDTLDALLVTAGITEPRVLVYGYSAGVLAAVDVALHKPPCGLMVESAWASVQAFASDSTFVDMPQSFLTTGAWDNVSKIGGVHVPYLGLHGTADDFVRIEFGRQLFDAANEPKQFIEVPGANHGNGGNDVPTVLGTDTYVSTVTTFLDSLDCANQQL